MKRRQFLTASGVATGAAALAACSATDQPAVEGDSPPSAADKPVRMYLGTQRSPTTAPMLEYLKRHGVNNICGQLGRPPFPERGYYSVDELSEKKDLCEKNGIVLDMVAAPFLPSSHIDRERRGAIMLGKEPERQRDIDDINKTIENCAKVGIPAIKYNMSILGVVRTERTPGRGGSTYSTWRLSEAKPDPAMTSAGKVDDETAWERISYFLDNVMPTADENNIRMACHPHDPGMPPEGYQGVVRVLGTAEGLYKFAGLYDSPNHGFNLCLGTTSEMLQNPREELHDVIRKLGGMRKIFNIHFRNIRGKRDDFQEVYPDEGDLVMPEVLRTLYEVDYPYMVMPDHMPRHEEDANGRQAFAYGFGYIKGLIQSLKYELGQDVNEVGENVWFPA